MLSHAHYGHGQTLTKFLKKTNKESVHADSADYGNAGPFMQPVGAGRDVGPDVASAKCHFHLFRLVDLADAVLNSIISANYNPWRSKMKLIPNLRILLLLIAAILMTVSTGCSSDNQSKPAEHSKNTAKAKMHMPPAGPEFLGGRVIETMNSGGYTYMLLSIGSDKTWVAVPEMKVKVGDDVVLMPGNEMHNFTSKTLNRTFKTIIFSPGPVGGAGGHGGMGGVMPGAMMGGSASSHGKTVAPLEQGIKVEKAKGDNAYTIAEIYAKAGELDGKTVKVRGKVEKISHNIMGKNWIHIQDGTGSADKNNFDLTVTTKANAQPGQIITATGKLAKEKDFGYGYRYKVIVENAEVEKQ